MPGAGRPRLRRGDITMREIIELSYDVYGRQVDNKARRMSIDIVSAIVIGRQNLVFDSHTQKWEQRGRGVKIIFNVQSNPKSYKRRDTVTIHRYPVTFLINDLGLGIDSPFRWRTGSTAMFTSNQKVPLGATPEARKRIAQNNLRILNSNITKGIQLQFFFDLENVLARYALLFGPDMTNHLPPRVRNPREYPFFDKTALFCVINVLLNLLTTKKEQLNRVFRNTGRVN